MSEAIAKTHSLRRTNAKGRPFIGCCVLCGRQNLTFEASKDYCENPTAQTEDGALVDAISGEAAQ